MGIRVEGDMDFQRWQMKKYGDIFPIVSCEMYSEYMADKEKRKEESYVVLIFIFLLFLITIIDFILLKCMGI